MQGHYARLGANLVLSLIAMYFVMFAMTDTTGDFFNNLIAQTRTRMAFASP